MFRQVAALRKIYSPIQLAALRVRHRPNQLATLREIRRKKRATKFAAKKARLSFTDSHDTDSVPTQHAAPLTEQDLYCHETLACQACVSTPPHPGQQRLYLCPDCAGPVTLERRLATLQRACIGSFFAAA
jgi:hypothetical protein